MEDREEAVRAIISPSNRRMVAWNGDSIQRAGAS
jgi:hypothetical protein